ncbi:MAG TPA: formate dehydrogenase subunit delta [Halomonas sp.]|nr:formate dehydrogenase subunit delta [Halomonas sp.]
MSAQRKNLIRMANQIAENLRHGRSDDQAVEETSTHLEKFWARSMKTNIIASLNDSDLDPLARQAVEQLAQRCRAD